MPISRQSVEYNNMKRNTNTQGGPICELIQMYYLDFYGLQYPYQHSNYHFFQFTALGESSGRVSFDQQDFFYFLFTINITSCKDGMQPRNMCKT